MPVQSPGQMTAAFLAAFNARDKQALLSLYADDAVFTFDGTATVSGLAAIDAAFDRAFASPLKMTGSVASLAVAGGTALLRMHRTLITPGGTTHSDGVSAEVLSRGTDGLWRYIIDDATGGGRSAGM